MNSRLQLLEQPGPAAPAPRPPTLKVAIASNGSKALDAHFGSARRFSVYEVTPTSARLCEVLSFDAASDGSGVHQGAADDRIGPKVAALRGVNLLFVLAIGGPAAARVVAARIHPVKLPGPESTDSILGRVQALMVGTPPPWLRKAMAGAGAPSLEDLEGGSTP